MIKPFGAKKYRGKILGELYGLRRLAPPWVTLRENSIARVMGNLKKTQKMKQGREKGL
jgi:hypothetical protein